MAAGLPRRVATTNWQTSAAAARICSKCKPPTIDKVTKMATLLQIVCAEGERFPEPPLESGLSVEHARAAAEELAGNLILVKEPGPSRPFARRRQSIRRALQPLLAGLVPSARTSAGQRSSVQSGVPEELRWLRENTRLLHAALQDTADLANVKHFPHVRTASDAVVRTCGKRSEEH